MTKLEEKIRDSIKKNGFITIDSFMSTSLFDKDDGYYIKKNPIGRTSDFITSPEISVLFGETLAAFIVKQIEDKLKNNQKINLIEIGAGKGTLLNDILNFLSKFNDIYQKINAYILEINPVLVEIQKQTLINHNDIIKWLNDLSEIDSVSPHIYICNEFFDALPVKQFVKQGDHILERVIRLDEKNNFIFDAVDTNPPEIIINDLDDYEDKAIIEYSEDSVSFMRQICNAIFKHKGFAIILDYGYADFVTGDTLQSIYQHEYNDIFKNIGNADLTTHVNFRLLYHTAMNCGIKDLYLQTQSDFLDSMGIRVRAENISRKLEEKEKNDLFMRVNRLINSTHMGTLFKCMVAEKF